MAVARAANPELTVRANKDPPAIGCPLSFTTLPLMVPVVGASEFFGAEGGTCPCAAMHNSNSTKVENLFMLCVVGVALQDYRMNMNYISILKILSIW